MKRTITLLLALCLGLSLCACGGSAAPTTGNVPASQTTGNAPASQTETAPAPAEEGVPMGQITRDGNGAHYTNAYLGVACDLDSSWYVYSEEEMAQLMGVSQELLEGTDYEELVKSADLYYDFCVTRLTDNATVNINYSQPVQGLENVSEDAVPERMLGQLKSSMEAAGMTDVQVDTVTVTFAGREKTAVRLSANFQGAAYHALQFYYFVNGRVATLTLGTFNEDRTLELTELFYALD